jgi:hypothetical protein
LTHLSCRVAFPTFSKGKIEWELALIYTHVWSSSTTACADVARKRFGTVLLASNAPSCITDLALDLKPISADRREGVNSCHVVLKAYPSRLKMTVSIASVKRDKVIILASDPSYIRKDPVKPTIRDT